MELFQFKQQWEEVPGKNSILQGNKDFAQSFESEIARKRMWSVNRSTVKGYLWHQMSTFSQLMLSRANSGPSQRSVWWDYNMVTTHTNAELNHWWQDKSPPLQIDPTDCSKTHEDNRQKWARAYLFVLATSILLERVSSPASFILSNLHSRLHRHENSPMLNCGLGYIFAFMKVRMFIVFATFSSIRYLCNLQREV